MNGAGSSADVAHRILAENSYATLATADEDGRPWATPVWFAARGLREYMWVSRTTRRHSQNVAHRAEIALVVFDSTSAVGSASAVYVDAVAALVADIDIAEPLAAFNATTRAAGLRPWAESAVTGDAPHRLYRATATQVWVLDDQENRTPVA